MKYLLKFIALVAGLWLADYIFAAVTIVDTQTLLLAALVLFLINTIVRPILHFLTIPINLLTLGLFGALLNLGLFWFGQVLVDGFTITGTWTTIGAAVVTLFIYNLVDDGRKSD